MKKAVFLSVVTSTMIFAGGDITPVEPIIETPAPIIMESSDWKFSGQGVVYYQTSDRGANTDLFSQAGSAADAGIQLKAVNKDLFMGFGAGVTVNGLATLDLEQDVVSNVMQSPNGGDLSGGWIAEAYLTYGMGNTTFKVGRQELPKSLSPFAFSEDWNVFTNTYNAALVLNSDIPDTLLVGAYVHRNNQNGYGVGNSCLTGFNDIKDQGAFMLTAQNKSIDSLVLTGSLYYLGAHFGPSGSREDGMALWGDLKYSFMDNYGIGLQAATMTSDAFNDDMVMMGAMAHGNFLDMLKLKVAYSNVNDGGAGIVNIGGQQTALYTQMLMNEGANSGIAGFNGGIKKDNDTFVVKTNMDLDKIDDMLGGNLCAAYGMTTDNSNANADYNEFDLVYKTNILGENLPLMGAYVMRDFNGKTSSVARFVGRYNF